MAPPDPPFTATPERRDYRSREALLQRVRGEFMEMPCLRLTRGQAQRLFALRPDICERVLAALIREQTLTCGSDGRYRITDTHLLRERAMSFDERVRLPPRAS